MTALNIQQVGAPSTPTYSAVTASDTVQADPAGLMLVVKNAGGSADNVTITDPGLTAAGSTASSPVVVVPATTGERHYLLTQAFANGSNIITITHSFTTSVTCAVFRIG
jgi:hypothetical protein